MKVLRQTPRRGKKSKQPTFKGELRSRFQELAKEKKVTYILHHPHTTDSIRTWSSAWGSVTKLFGQEIKYAGAVRRYNKDDPGNERSSMDDIRDKTRNGVKILDFVLSA